VLSPDDLREVDVAADPSLSLVLASAESSVLGRPVALPLPAGTLLTTADVGSGQVPPPGWAVVGVALKAGQYPPEVAPGDRVLIVTAGTGASGTGAVGTAPPVPATVVGVQAAPVDSQAAAVVSLQVSEADAQSVAIAASNGAVSIVLVSQQGGAA
jgi:hypothetical protein